MSGISTHVLDTSKGVPAAGIRVQLEKRSGADQWAGIGSGVTDSDGRVRSLAPATGIATGVHRLRFETGAYLGPAAFFPYVEIVFDVQDTARNYHVPLLLSPFAYSTYRGS